MWPVASDVGGSHPEQGGKQREQAASSLCTAQAGCTGRQAPMIHGKILGIAHRRTAASSNHRMWGQDYQVCIS